ncbi:unnamed protein product [Schistocephalus solidus]|uniref:Secreted protein n=1 Tax=Schistocephalus solidus TaxID=70667 RepID=A0A183TRY3_SCHSO|nr:unnamed protein product [Schistocephalus solidus]
MLAILGTLVLLRARLSEPFPPPSTDLFDEEVPSLHVSHISHPTTRQSYRPDASGMFAELNGCKRSPCLVWKVNRRTQPFPSPALPHPETSSIAIGFKNGDVCGRKDLPFPDLEANVKMWCTVFTKSKLERKGGADRRTLG